MLKLMMKDPLKMFHCFLLSLYPTGGLDTRYPNILSVCGCICILYVTVFLLCVFVARQEV